MRPNTPDPAKPLRNDVSTSELPARAIDRGKIRAGNNEEDALPIEDLPPRENVRGG